MRLGSKLKGGCMTKLLLTFCRINGVIKVLVNEDLVKKLGG